MRDYSLTFNFDESGLPIGKVSLQLSVSSIPNIHEFFIAPAYEITEDGTYNVVSYSLVHRSLIATAAEMEQREKPLAPVPPSEVVGEDMRIG